MTSEVTNYVNEVLDNVDTGGLIREDTVKLCQMCLMCFDQLDVLYTKYEESTGKNLQDMKNDFEREIQKVCDSETKAADDE